MLLEAPAIVFLWDGQSELTIQDEPWWIIRAENREAIARAMLFHLTADSEVADRRAKELATSMLAGLAGRPSSIHASAVESWLVSPKPRPAPLFPESSPDARVRCAKCGHVIPLHPMHLAIVQAFGTLCDTCRGVAA